MASRNSAQGSMVYGSNSMKCSTAALSVATLSLAMCIPALGQGSAQSGQHEADRMVPARASLTHALDSKDVKSGYQFRATLNDNVHLNDGVELHHGDVLLGRVTADDMNVPGKAHLAVRFNQAVLKDGQTIPIKATIVSVYSPGELPYSYGSPEQIPNSWNDGTLRVDQLGVVKDVDLHSRISSHNSGVFVSTKKDDVKLPAGSEIALAIAARNNNGPTNPANSGS